MKKFLSVFGVILIMIGIFGLSYTYNYDHRKADSLSAYCNIEFNSSKDAKGKIEGAVLNLWDYRYDDAKMTDSVIIYTDGKEWEAVCSTKQTYLGFGSEHSFMHENKMFLEFPRASLDSIKKAESVRLRFYYDNGQTIDLPLNSPDLAYWQRHLE